MAKTAQLNNQIASDDDLLDQALSGCKDLEDIPEEALRILTSHGLTRFMDRVSQISRLESVRLHQSRAGTQEQRESLRKMLPAQREHVEKEAARVEQEIAELTGAVNRLKSDLRANESALAAMDAGVSELREERLLPPASRAELSSLYRRDREMETERVRAEDRLRYANQVLQYFDDDEQECFSRLHGCVVSLTPDLLKEVNAVQEEETAKLQELRNVTKAIRLDCERILNRYVR